MVAHGVVSVTFDTNVTSDSPPRRKRQKVLGCRRWTKSDERLLRELVQTGERGPDIAKELNRTALAVRRRCIELGLKLRKNVILRLDLRVRMLDLVAARPGITVRELRRLSGVRHASTMTYYVKVLVRDGLATVTGNSSARRMKVTSKWFKRDDESG